MNCERSLSGQKCQWESFFLVPLGLSPAYTHFIYIPGILPRWPWAHHSSGTMPVLYHSSSSHHFKGSFWCSTIQGLTLATPNLTSEAPPRQPQTECSSSWIDPTPASLQEPTRHKQSNQGMLPHKAAPSKPGKVAISFILQKQKTKLRQNEETQEYVPGNIRKQYPKENP